MSVNRLVELKGTTMAAFRDWVQATNPAWLGELDRMPLAVALASSGETRYQRRWRDRIADGLILFANVYRAHGVLTALRVLMGAARGPLRRLVRGR